MFDSVCLASSGGCQPAVVAPYAQMTHIYSLLALLILLSFTRYC